MTKLKVIVFAIGFIAVLGMGCNSNKVSCPTYANSFPEKKSKTKPGAQKPQLPKATKPKSGVLPPGR
jgi:hypothetical protein